MWKKISSKKIFDHPRLSLIEDDVELPNGHLTKYLRYGKRDDCATIICRRDDGKIIVSKEYSYPIDQVMHQFPGGGIEKDETAEEGAQREIQEEVCFKANNLELLGYFIMNNRRSKAKMYVFLATNLEESSLEGDITEEIEIEWFTEKEIDDMIKTGKIINSPALSSWALYKSKNN